MSDYIQVIGCVTAIRKEIAWLHWDEFLGTPLPHEAASEEHPLGADRVGLGP